MSDVGIVFDRGVPAGQVADYARRAEAAGLDHLWVIEDCFFTSGVSLASAALASTERIGVGLGVLPVVGRNAAITAMELATLAEIGPGRLTAGLGHGVQSWMAKIGARPSSPLTALDEYFTAIGRLLDGETVSFDGQYVTLDEVALDPAPSTRPPLIAGVRGPKSMQVAGRVADGLLLAEGAGPTYVNTARKQAGASKDFIVDIYAIGAIEADRPTAYRAIAGLVVELVEARVPALTCLPFYDEMRERVETDGVDGIVEMPHDYWAELGPIGTLDDAAAFVESCTAAGVRSVNFHPGPGLEYAHDLIDQLSTLP